MEKSHQLDKLPMTLHCLLQATAWEIYILGQSEAAVAEVEHLH